MWISCAFPLLHTSISKSWSNDRQDLLLIKLQALSDTRRKC